MIVGASGFRQVNTGLLTVTVALALYIIGAPFFPDATFQAGQWWARLTGSDFSKSASVIIAKYENGSVPIPKDDRLIIPSIGVDGTIYESRSIEILAKGIWRRPRSSTPDKGSNTVLVAHRFLYTSGPITFYHLDKVKVDDMISVFWKGREYRYQVYETMVVLPSALEIEQPTKDPILTLYTCTPLLTGTDRLMVRAKLLNPI